MDASEIRKIAGAKEYTLGFNAEYLAAVRTPGLPAAEQERVLCVSNEIECHNLLMHIYIRCFSSPMLVSDVSFARHLTK